MVLIVSSNEDSASINIRNNLLKLVNWERIGEFDRNAVYYYDNLILITINKMHLYHDNIDKEAEKFGKIENVIFISRHRSETGMRTLTIHPIGNFSSAEFGGKNYELVKSSPQLMTNALRILKENAKENYVSFEVTHHGPFLQTASFYIEIGSDENCWKDENFGEIIAKTLLRVVKEKQENKVAIGIGGGHYAPRFTELSLTKKISFGHMISNYALENIKDEMLEKAIKETPNCEYVYFHKKAMKSAKIKDLEKFFEERGIKSIRSNDLINLEFFSSSNK